MIFILLMLQPDKAQGLEELCYSVLEFTGPKSIILAVSADIPVGLRLSGLELRSSPGLSGSQHGGTSYNIVRILPC